MKLVLDASVCLSWCFEDEAVEYADAALDALGSTEAIVPVIWALEVANGLLVAERRGRLTRADTSKAVAVLDELSITVGDAPSTYMLVDLLSLARDQRLSVYDATYLDLAIRHACPIATLDAGLKRACERTGVAIWEA